MPGRPLRIGILSSARIARNFVQAVRSSNRIAALVEHGPGAWNGATPEESIDIALTLEAILTSARERRPVDIFPDSP